MTQLALVPAQTPCIHCTIDINECNGRLSIGVNELMRSDSESSAISLAGT